MSDTQVFDINDRETGKVYRIRSDAPDATREEAIEYVSGLSDEERASFEYNPETPQVAAPSQESVPVPASTEGTVLGDGESLDLGPINKSNIPAPQVQTETVAEGALIQEEARDPRKIEATRIASQIDQMVARGDSAKDIEEFAASRGIIVSNLESNLARRDRGEDIGGVTLSSAFDDMFAPKAPEDPGERGGLDRLVDAYNDATQYGFAGLAARVGNDWLDTSKDTLRKAFPGRSEEWYEEMHDYSIVQTQKKLRTEASMLQEMDPNWRPDKNFFQNILAIERWAPWFLGQTAGSAGPEMAVAPGASLGARAAAQGAIGGVTDLGYQTGDVIAGVEDEISWESVVLNVAMGVGGEAVFTGAARAVGLDSARGRGVDSTEVRNARFPRALEELDETIPARTTTDRRTKAYRTETWAAQNAVTDRINMLTQDWTNAPDFEVHAGFDNIRELDNDALGVYRTIVEPDGTRRSVVAMNTSAILEYAQRTNVSADDVVRSVVFHEGLGHHGLASKYGDELDSVMASFYDQGDADFRARVDSYMRAVGEDDYVLATEETLAVMSERGELPVRMMDRLTTFFRGWAREIPWVGKRMKFTDNEVRTLLGMSQRETTRGAPQAGVGEGDKYMVTYHGSGADFDRFDHSFMSTGEGNQAFGWGTYLTDSKQIGESYRDMIGGTQPEWNGVGTTWHQLRSNAKSDIQTKFPEVTSGDLQVVDDLITDISVNGSRVAPIPESSREVLEWYDGVPTGDQSEFIRRFDPVLEYVRESFNLRSGGRLYEVNVPDDVKFNEWELPVSEQPLLKEALEKGDYRVTDYSTWNQINREAFEARTKYENLNKRLEFLDQSLRDAEAAGYIETERSNSFLDELSTVPATPENIAKYEKVADELFQQLQEASIKRTEAVNRAKMYFHEDMTGEDVYGQLAATLGGGSKASQFLAGQGIQGNRYLANNIRKGRQRGGDDKFNYVVFDDSVPEIINKYSHGYKPSEATSAGFKRRNPDTRDFTTVLRNARRMKADLREEAGLPREEVHKYMKPRDLQDTAPISADDLTPDELFDSLNALDILKRITPEGERTVYNMDDLQSDAAARGISPSALLKKAAEGEGSLSKSLFMYDLAAQKMNDRVTQLYSKIQSGQYTMRDKDNYLKAILGFEDLTAKIFDQQSEVGRALRAIQEMEYTRNRVTTLRDTLRGLESNGIEALDDPATFEKFARQIQENLDEMKAAQGNRANPIIQTLNVPRAIMSSMDLSAPLRQGIFFITKPAYWKAFIDMHTSFGSQKKYDSIMDDITSRPTYEAMMKARLAFSRIDEGAPLSAREEDFQTDLAAQIPIVGVGVKASNRAYSAFRNKLSADMFDEYYNKMQRSGMDMNDVDTLRRMAAFVNAATGRGNLPEFLRSAGPQLNSVFFSPRLIMSRLNLLNPVFYWKLPPVVRREAIIQAAAMGSLATLTLGTIDHFVPDAEVEFDSRHTDFGKVRVGDTRFDVLGGFAQFIRLGARLATGRTISSSDRVSDYKAAPFIQGIHDGLRSLYEYSSGEAAAPADPQNPAYSQTLKDSISQFLENKFSPNASYVNDMLKGEDFIGKEFDPVDGALSRVMPMYFQDMAELASEQGPGPIATGFGIVASLYGVGTSTYISSSLDPNQELEVPETMTDNDLADGENEWVSVSNGTITLKPKAREMYQRRVNTYFDEIMEYEMSQDNWSEIERKTQAEIIKEAKKEARDEARKDMRITFGID